MSEGILAPPKLPTPTGAFDALMRDLLDRMHEMAQGARATMGTITSISGGEIVVHIDGERISRSVGFARKKGIKYEVGDRVLLQPTRSDEYVVAGVIGSDSMDNRVGTDQLATGSVRWFELDQELQQIINSKGGGITQATADLRYLRKTTYGGITGADDLYFSLKKGNENVKIYNDNNTGYLIRFCRLERKLFKGRTYGPCS